MKSFGASVPIWRLASAKNASFKSFTTGAGQLASSLSVSCGDQPPQNNERPARQ